MLAGCFKTIEAIDSFTIYLVYFSTVQECKECHANNVLACANRRQTIANNPTVKDEHLD